MMVRIPSLLLVLLSSALALVHCAEDSRPQPKTPDNGNSSTDEARANESSRPLDLGPDGSAPHADASDSMGEGGPSGTTETTGGTVSGSTGAGDTSGGAAAQADAATAPFTDEQIIGVLITANNGEIEQARLAQTKAKDARVKRYAGMIITDHTAANAKTGTVARMHKIAPADSNLRVQIAGDSSTIMDMLRAHSGSDFDRVYIDAQVKEHRQVLDTIDNRLMPNAKNPDLKALIVEIRPKIEGHLRDAQSLEPLIGPSGTTTNTPH